MKRKSHSNSKYMRKWNSVTKCHIPNSLIKRIQITNFSFTALEKYLEYNLIYINHASASQPTNVTSLSIRGVVGLFKFRAVVCHLSLSLSLSLSFNYI